MRFDKNSVRNGMFVMGTQGERIGKVILLQRRDVRGREGSVLSQGLRASLRPHHRRDGWHHPLRADRLLARAYAGGSERRLSATAAGPALAGAASAAATTATRRADTAADRDRDEIRIPLLREEIGIEKVARESGHVRIHKTVITEEKRFSVPVTREEVIIEHVAIGRDAALTGDDAFQEDTVDVPLYEEEVRVSKHPVLEEEVVVRTVAHSVDREGSAMLRHEEAEIEDTRKSPGLSPSGADYDYSDPDIRH